MMPARLALVLQADGWYLRLYDESAPRRKEEIQLAIGELRKAGHAEYGAAD